MRKKIHTLVTIFICLIGFSSIQAQDLFAKANKQFELGSYDLAINNYQQLLKKDPANVSAIGSLAEAYFRTQNYMEAISLYEELAGYEAMEPRHILNYAHVMKSLGLYDKAKIWYLKYGDFNASVAEHYAMSCDQATTYLQQPDKYDVSLFDGNSRTSDFGVSFYGDKLIFCSFRSDMKRETRGTTFTQTPNKGNRLFTCPSKTNGSFMNMDFLRFELKDSYNIGPLSYDGGKVVYTRNNFADGFKQVSGNEKDLNIFLGEVTDTNGDFKEETAFIHNESGSSAAFATFLNEGSSIIFASNRIGGNGKFDLYISHKERGTWSYPENLGDIINSPGNEITPFVQGNKLYFSSDYHMGIGGYDVFEVSIYEDGTFGSVTNLGKGVNSPMDDYYYVVDASSDLAYFSSNRLGGKGSEDIYIASNLEPASLAIDKLVPLSVDLDNLVAKNSGLEGKGMSSTVSFEDRAVKVSDKNTAQTKVDATAVITEYVVFEESTQIESLASDQNKKDQTLKSPADISTTLAGSNDIAEKTAKEVETPSHTASVIVFGTDNMFDLKGATKIAHNDIITTASHVYFIQLASLSNSRGDIRPFLKLSELGNLYKVRKGGTIKIRMGYYFDEAEAMQKLAEVKNRGFRDAFVVYEPLITSQLELINVASTQVYYEGDYIPKGTVSNYKIRLASYTDPLWFDTGSVMDIGEIEQWTKGDFTIFVLSGYTSIQEAEKALIKALNRGYSEAHIVEDINGYLKRVQRN